MKKDKFEVLAPVGNDAMLSAAIKAGADAVYLGGKLFSARAFAENFTIDNIKDLVKKCHSNGIKVYITVNTLLHENELEEALNYIIDLYNSDIDAVIIQDLGLLSLIKKYIPKLEVHASTQINIYNYYGAKMMKELGFKRVVLARETTIEEIKYIAENVDIELEVFIHGSLCVATSGQCLMSSYIGGRSGNRGKCAQPCRKEYGVYNEAFERVDSDAKSYLSPKDLCTIENVNELRDLGVKSFKIEGRMKKPEYVYTVVDSYKKKLNGENTNLEKLDEVSNRGYTKGLIFHEYGNSFIEIDRSKSKKGTIVGKIISNKNKRGIIFTKETLKGDILLIETEKGKIIQFTLKDNYSLGEIVYDEYIYDAKINSSVIRTSSIEIKEELMNKQIDSNKRIDFKFSVKSGETAKLYVFYKDVNFLVESDNVILKALNQPIHKDKVKEQLSKLGNTNYILNSISIEMEENLFIPIKILNQMRRDAVNLLDSSINDFNKREFLNHTTVEFENISKKSKNRVSVNSEIVNGEGDILNKYGDIYSNRFLNNSEYYLKLPRLSMTKDLILFKESGQFDNVKGFLVNNIGDILFIRENFPEKIIVGDIGLNVLNSKTYEILKGLEVSRITLSTELNIDELNEVIDHIDDSFEIVAHGMLTSMVIKNCPFSLLKGCKNDNYCNNCKYSNDYYLKNDREEYFLVNRYNGYSELYNSKLLNSYDIIRNIDFNGTGNIRIINYKYKDSLESLYFNNINSKKTMKVTFDNYTRGHLEKGID